MPTIGTRSALAIAFAAATPTRKAGVEARPDVDGHGADLVETDPRLLHDELDRRARASRRGADRATTRRA